MDTASGGEIAAEVRSGVATVTLNRPAALNALSLGMLEALSRWLEAWRHDPQVRALAFRGAGGKAFCAGGDIRALHDALTADDHALDQFFALEYALDFRIHTYPKPIVALMDGIVMGGGMGISQGAALRIVGERTKMAMPETAIGLFPDVGGSYFLSRTPGKLGPYLGLVGVTIGAADAIYAGLASHPTADLAALPPGELATLRPAIDRHFGRGSVRAIIESLREERDPAYREWAERTLEALARRSPTMLEVTLEQLRRGATMPLADCFRMELGMVHECFEHGDMVEGIRALIVEKDNRPRWNPPTLEEVRPESVARFFAPRWAPREHPLANIERTP